MISFKFKQVIVVRSDLRMSPGKLAAQVAHAAVAAADRVRRERPEWFDYWFMEGQKKVVVKVLGEGELYEVERRAGELQVPTALVRDRGLTELPPDTVTCLGLGPAPIEVMDKATGHLKLL